MTDRLMIIADGRIMGHIDCGPNITLTFTYSDDWRADPNSYPLSLSMPLAAKTHKGEQVSAYIWGLLPDNDRVLSEWAKKFQISARNPFKLIANVGEDCAGAIQFVRPERTEAILSGQGDVEWLDEAEIATRLKQLRNDHAATRHPRDTGQFSLAGAQPKTALLFQDGKWGVPWGNKPTTHILKPPTGKFDGFAENEHFCMELARAMGMPIANSQLLHFEDETAISVERYDRYFAGSHIKRIHQEDFCQGMGIHPAMKYQSDGGPGIEDCISFLRSNSHQYGLDEKHFFEAMAFNWLIAGTDAHAKNYSVLIGETGRARLAPLYDISSALPYPDLQFQKLKLAMKIGGEYRICDITLRQWEKLWANTRYDTEHGRIWLSQWCEKLPDIASDTRGKIEASGLAHPILERLQSTISERAQTCRKLF